MKQKNKKNVKKEKKMKLKRGISLFQAYTTSTRLRTINMKIKQQQKK